MNNPSNRFVTSTRNRDVTKRKNELSVVILCGVMGYRMKSYGSKALLSLEDGVKVIDRIIENVCIHFPNSEIIVSVGFDADNLISHLPQTVHVVENQLHENTNTLEELRLAMNASTNENVLVIHGDLIFNQFALEKVTRHGSSIVVDTKDQIDSDEVGATIVDNKVTIMTYGVDTKWGYIAYFTGRELELLRSIVSNRTRKKWFIFEAVNEVINKGGTFTPVENKRTEIYRINKIKDWKGRKEV